MSRWVTWVDISDTGPAEHTATDEEVIGIMREVGVKMGKPYNSDEEAFWDFVVVHWADIHTDDGVL
jgi:accessory colonization factor AcfC